MRSEVEKAVKLAGGELQLAVLARVTQRAVQHWRESGRVSATAARLIELELKGKVKEERLSQRDEAAA